MAHPPSDLLRDLVRDPPRAWRLVALCVPLTLLGACATSEKTEPVAVKAVVQAPGKAVVTVSDAQDGAAVVLQTGQELRLALSLSSSEVASNNDWSIVDQKPGVLTALGSRFERSGRDTNPSEAEGSMVFRVKAQAPGRVTLGFSLRRAYSLGAPTRSVSFDVTVK